MTKTQQTKTPLDLTSFAHIQSSQEEGLEVVIRHPLDPDIETGMVIVIAGPDSEKRLKAQRVSIDARLKRGKRKLTAEEIEQDAKKILARSVLSWSGFVENGQALECTVENVMHVFTKYKFIHEQVDEVANDRASFTKDSQTNSVSI